jgi:hypothetical protein
MGDSMNLLCPHCQKMVSASDDRAGQALACPYCNETFTVPSLPQAPPLTPLLADLPEDIPLAPEPINLDPPESPSAAHAQTEHEPGVYSIVPEPPKPAPPPSPPRRENRTKPAPSTPPGKNDPAPTKSLSVAASTAPKPPPPLPPAGYTRAHVLQISPQVVPWIAPVAMAIVFLLFFFTWTGLYPGGYSLFTQRGYQTIWGGVGPNEIADKALGGHKPFEDAGGNWLMLLYFLLVITALVLASAPIVLQRTEWKLPRNLQELWPWRLAALAGVTGVALLFLFIQLWAGFGLENAVAASVNKSSEAQMSAAKTSEEREIVAINRGLLIDQYHIERTVWCWFEVIGLLAALAGVGLEFCLEKRGTQAVPQLELRW